MIIHHPTLGTIGVVFSIYDAENCFMNAGPYITTVLCVDVPRSAFVTTVADAVKFFNSTEKT